MSFTDPDGVQPDPGQGAGGNDAPYAEYLNRIPEEYRGDVEPIFKEWDGNVTKRFQEHSERLRQWEPYQQVGIDQYDPQSLASLIEFGRMASDPDAYRQWLQAEAERAGLLGQSEPDDEFEDDLLDPSVTSFFERAMSPYLQKMEAIEAKLQAQETHQQTQAREAMWNRQFEELTSEHGELDRDIIQTFAAKYADDPENAIKRGFEDFQRMRAQIEQQVLRGKLNQPPSPSGQPGVAPQGDRPRTLEEAQKALRERLEQSASL